MSNPDGMRLTGHIAYNATGSGNAEERDVRPKTNVTRPVEPVDHIGMQQDGPQSHAGSAMETATQGTRAAAASQADEEWRLAEKTIRGQTDNFLKYLDPLHFLGDVAKEKPEYAQLQSIIDRNTVPIEKLDALLDHIFKNKDSFLLSRLVSYKNLERLNLRDDLGELSIISCPRKGVFFWNKKSEEKLAESLVDCDVDVIADELYGKRHIDRVTRDIIQQKKSTEKIKTLIANVITNAAFACLLDVLAGDDIIRRDLREELFQLSQIKIDEPSEMKTEEVTAMKIDEQLGFSVDAKTINTYKDDFIARYVIRECSYKLLSELIPVQVDSFVDELYQNGVLDSEMKESIFQEELKRSKTRRLLDKLLFVGWKGYSHLKPLLDKSGSGHLTEMMDTVETSMRGKTDVEIGNLMIEEVAEIRCYFELYDGMQWKIWDLKKAGTKEEAIKLAQIILRVFGLQLKNLDEGSLVMSLTCNSLDGLVKFYKAYKSGELVEMFTSSAEKVKIVVDKHTLILAFVILVNKDWPQKSEATQNVQLENFLGDDMRVGQQAVSASSRKVATKGRTKLRHIEEDLHYDMTHKYRGLFIIINNKNFDPVTGRESRVGSDIDAENLQNVFEKLGFDVRRSDNLTCRKMDAIMKEVRVFDHRQNDCFACAILTHGTEDEMLLGTDAMISLEMLTNHVKGINCPSLVGKPKFFFIQACRGKKVDVGVDISDGASHARIIQKIPVEADLLVVNSTAPGYISWTSENGSFFIEALCDVFGEHGSTLEIMELLTMVNREVAYDFQTTSTDPEQDGLKQIPSITSQLTKKLYFANSNK